MTFYLYDPKTNITEEIKTLKHLADVFGVTLSAVSHAHRKGHKLSGHYVTKGYPSLKQRREWYAGEAYPDEHFTAVEGSNNEFRVSNYGRIKRIYKNGKERYMMPFRRKGRGNLFAKLSFLGKYGEHKIGHVVAHHFLRPKKPEENLIRKNRIVTDDYAGNLEYVTKQELGNRTGYQAKSKAVVQLDLETNELINEFRSIREAGRKCFLSHEAVRHNVLGKSKHSGGYKFMYLDDYEKQKTIKIG